MSIEPGNHPDRELIERFVRNETDRAENQTVVRHLLRGCPECLKVVRALWYTTELPRACLFLVGDPNDLPDRREYGPGN